MMSDWPGLVTTSSGHAIQVGVDGPDAVHGQALLAAGPVRRILRGDEVLERGQAHVRQVDAAEHAVPVAVVGLALEQVVGGALADRSLGQRLDRGGGPQHLLVEVVDLPVLDLEVAPEPAPHPARLRAALGQVRVEHLRESAAFLGGQ